MPLLDWLREAVGLDRGPVLPALLRVRQPGGEPAPLVRLSGEFVPSGQRIARTLTTADGLCMVEWPANARSMHIRLGAGQGSAELDIDSRRPDPDRVIEVQLA